LLAGHHPRGGCGGDGRLAKQPSGGKQPCERWRRRRRW
jgi:hypothetical protein